jgi:hypothetical protein
VAGRPPSGARRVHAGRGTQHAFISEKVAIDAAQIWLGIIEDQPGL